MITYGHSDSHWWDSCYNIGMNETRKTSTIQEVIERAVALNPIQAIRTRKDSDAAMLWVDEIIDDNGDHIKLKPCTNGLNGKSGYVFIYGRVSTPRQTEKERSGEGWSMRTQFERGVYYAVSNGWRFCIFSDAELSGGMPTNDATVIRTLYTTKANVYRSVMRAIWLPEHYKPRPDHERRSIEQYIDKKCKEILSGKFRPADELEEAEVEKKLESQLATINTRGQEVIKKIYRPGLNCALSLLKQAAMLVVTDSSRVARSQYLMQHILPQLRDKDVRTKGVIEEWDWPNQDGIGPALQGGVLSALHEDMIRSAIAGALRGSQTRLERGEPFGLLPFWYVKTPRGEACSFCGEAKWSKLKSEHHLCSIRVQHAQKMVSLYLDAGDDTERGYRAVGSALEDEGIPPKRANMWHWTAVRKVLTNPALIGQEREFGLLWETLDRIITDDEWLRVCHKIKERADKVHNNPPAAASRHELTGLLECVCGLSMSYNGTETPHAYDCNVRRYGRVGDRLHTRVLAEDVHGFLDSIFQEYGPYVLSHLSDNQVERYKLLVNDVKADLLAVIRDIPLFEANARKDAEADLEVSMIYQRQKGSDGGKKMLDAAVEMLMSEHYTRRDELRNALAVANHDLSLHNMQQFRAEAELRIEQWRSASVEDRNAFYRMYFSVLRFKGEKGGERLVPILRDGVTRWPDIELRVTGTKAFRRRMPLVEDFITSTYESVLSEADEA